MRNSLLTAALFAGLIALSLAADAATTQPASQPAATAPANKEDAAIKAAVMDFFNAGYTADEKALIDSLYFKTLESKEMALPVLSSFIADQKLAHAMHNFFDDKTKFPPDGLDEEAADETQKRLAASTIKIDGDSAIVLVEERPAWRLVKVNNTWKVDFDNSKSNMDFTDAAIAKAKVHTQIINSLIADVQAGKFKSSQEVIAKFRELFAATKGAATQSAPATQQNK